MGPRKVERCHSRSSNLQQHKTNLATKNKKVANVINSLPKQPASHYLPKNGIFWLFLLRHRVCMYVCNQERLCLCRRSDSTKWGQACSPNLKLDDHDDHDDDNDTEHPSSLLLLVRENAPPACRNLWSRFFWERGEEAKRTTFKTNSEWESKRTPITEGEFWAERAANTPEQNGQVGLVTTPFAVDAYETRPRVRPPTLAVSYPFAASLQRASMGGEEGGPLSLRWRKTLAIPIPRTCEGVVAACVPAYLTRKRVKEKVAGPIVNRRKPFSWRGRCLGCCAGKSIQIVREKTNNLV
jgi:hypothetical protein